MRVQSIYFYKKTDTMKRSFVTIGSCKLILTFSFVSVLGSGCISQNNPNAPTTPGTQPAVQVTLDTIQTPGTPTTGKKKIKVAILLDTSNSMDGLIDQAKSQLWKIINELAKAKCENERPDLEIALYEYGNDGLSSAEGYIRQVSMFINDLDKISEQLFSLRTNGGNEFCGQVIHTSLKQLQWSDGNSDLQLIFIAGNEPFTQGPVAYATACKEAVQKDVVVNTIFCGNFDMGINTSWKTGADFTGGNYMSIEQDRKTVYIETPYDKEIAQMNESLNGTYIGYGYLGIISKENQKKQDENAKTYGWSNNANRIVSKSSHLYKNESWDLVDASGSKEFDITKVKETDLPKELQGKTTVQKQKYIEDKKNERAKVNASIGELNTKRVEYIAQKEKEMGQDTSNSLDAAMIAAIKSKAKTKNFTFDN